MWPLRWQNNLQNWLLWRWRMQRGLTCLLQRLPVDRMLCPGHGTNDVSHGPSLFAVWCIHSLIVLIGNLNLKVLKFILRNITVTLSSKLVFLKQLIFTFDKSYFETDLSNWAELFRIWSSSKSILSRLCIETFAGVCWIFCIRFDWSPFHVIYCFKKTSKLFVFFWKM